jgi:hypothetical protein
VATESNDTPIDTWFSGGRIVFKGEQDKPHRTSELIGSPAEIRTPDLYLENFRLASSDTHGISVNKPDSRREALSFTK